MYIFCFLVLYKWLHCCGCKWIYFPNLSYNVVHDFYLIKNTGLFNFFYCFVPGSLPPSEQFPRVSLSLDPELGPLFQQSEGEPGKGLSRRKPGSSLPTNGGLAKLDFHVCEEGAVSRTPGGNCVCRHSASIEASWQCLGTAVFGRASAPWGMLLEERVDGRQDHQERVRDLRFHLHRKGASDRQELQFPLHLWWEWRVRLVRKAKAPHVQHVACCSPSALHFTSLCYVQRSHRPGGWLSSLPERDGRAQGGRHSPL